MYNMGGDGGAGGDREDGSPSGKIPHTIVGYQTSAAELEENMRQVELMTACLVRNLDLFNYFPLLQVFASY